MEEETTVPYLYSVKSLKDQYKVCRKIPITSNEITIGRNLDNSFVIPHIYISRQHCRIKNVNKNWVIEDLSSFGIKVNGEGVRELRVPKVIKNNDVIQLDQQDEFVYKFVEPEIARLSRKRKVEIEPNVNELIGTLQKLDSNHIYKKRAQALKLKHARHTQSETKTLKDAFEVKMKTKIKDLKETYEKEIANLKGEKNVVEKEKIALETARDSKLKALEDKMKAKISKMTKEIAAHNETEQRLIHENEQLKLRLEKEREEHLKEMKKTCSKDLLDIMQSTIKTQEIIRAQDQKDMEALKEKNTLCINMLHKAEKIEREMLEKEQNLNKIQEECNKKEKQWEIEKELSSLNHQPNLSIEPAKPNPPTSLDVEKEMENELQCSICAELFIQATTLNCSHTFCQYCITQWKKRSRFCPNCRTPIVSECRGLALDCFIEKMVDKLSEELKQNRQSLLRERIGIEVKKKLRKPKKKRMRQ